VSSQAQSSAEGGRVAARRAVGHEGERYAGAAAIVARIRRHAAAREVAEALRSEIAAVQRLSEASQQDILTGVERSMLRWWRWLATRVTPSDEDFDPLREWTRARAGEGVRLEELLRVFGVGREVGWELIRRHARTGETEALLDAAGLFMRYLDHASAVVADAYLAERDALVSEEERHTRNILERVGSGAPLDPRELELAERLGVTVDSAYSPFVALMPARTARQHATLARQLRRRGWPLTVTDGARVVGLSARPLTLADIDEGPDVLLVVADATHGDQLGEVRDDVMLLAEHGRRAGRYGLLRAEEHLLEILLARAPALAARLHSRVLGPLTDPDHDELLRTLRAFVAHDYDRAATSEAVHIHRNTLAYRLRRVEELTGLRLANARDLACLYLAVAGTGELVQVHRHPAANSSERR
jgi:hypothetical protein